MSEQTFEFRDSIGHVYRLPESVFTLCAERITVAVVNGRHTVARWMPDPMPAHIGRGDIAVRFVDPETYFNVEHTECTP